MAKVRNVFERRMPFAEDLSFFVAFQNMDGTLL